MRDGSDHEDDGMSKAELEAAALTIADGRQIEWLPSEQLIKVMTIGQYVADRCLAEIENRGELTFEDGMPLVPYQSDHVIETILTRPEGTGTGA